MFYNKIIAQFRALLLLDPGISHALVALVASTGPPSTGLSTPKLGSLRTDPHGPCLLSHPSGSRAQARRGGRLCSMEPLPEGRRWVPELRAGSPWVLTELWAQVTWTTHTVVLNAGAVPATLRGHPSTQDPRCSLEAHLLGVTSTQPGRQATADFFSPSLDSPSGLAKL